MDSKTNNLYEQMPNTAEALSTEHAAQLIAAMYVYGDESAAFPAKMNADIRYVQKRFGLEAGETPDAKFIGKVIKYMYDIRKEGRPAWLGGLEERYSVTFQEVG